MHLITAAAIIFLATPTVASACLTTWFERPSGASFAQHYMRNDCGATVRLVWADGTVTFLNDGQQSRYYGTFSWSVYD